MPSAAQAAVHRAGRPYTLVLGGGGARGFVHAGVLRALDRLGTRRARSSACRWARDDALLAGEGYADIAPIDVARDFGHPIVVAIDPRQAIVTLEFGARRECIAAGLRAVRQQRHALADLLAAPASTPPAHHLRLPVRNHYVWLIWSSAFLVPWLALYLTRPDRRRAMWWTSLATSLFGLTEPIFVPRYWNPPSLFDLAQRTGFDVESLIFCFAIGGIGLVTYDALSGQQIVPLDPHERQHRRHRFHRLALAAPVLAFVPLYILPWNPIYPAIASLAIGAVAGMACRPDLTRRMMLGGALFGALYAVFIFGLRVGVPGYIAEVWNLGDLSGVILAGVPLEELLFGITFGMYWSGVYEHLTWHGDAHR